MGVFAEWQPRYAEHGIATFPAIDKKPAVRGWHRITPRASAQLAFRFTDAREIAFCAGKGSGITVVDVDTRDEAAWRDAVRRFGETRIMVRTGSGNLQLWYRYAGEGRKIRVEGCVDILGSGQVLAPPSERGQGYQLIRGTLDDLDRLAPARNIEAAERQARQLVGQGHRRDELVKHLRAQARFCDDLEQLVDVGLTFAEERIDRQDGHAFTDQEIERQARSVWAWTQEKIAAGEYFVGQGRRLIVAHDTLDRIMPLGADPLMLFLHLQRRSAFRGEIIVANDLRLAMPDGEWSLPRFRKARAALIQAGVLKETRPASTWHGPATYACQG
jgi:hypothetical protein